MEIDREKYKVWDKKNLNVVHFMVNPGLAFNELVLGQRIPKIMLIDQTSDKPLMERTYVPCANCHTYHDGRTWSQKNKTVFKNWFGLYCPACGAIIPCVRNWTSGLILAVTYPLWFWWISRWKEAWLKKQPERYVNLKFEAIEHQQVKWQRMGLRWRLIMYVVMTLLLPLVTGTDYNLFFMATSITIWLLGGLGFGWVMQKSMGKKSPKSAS